MTGPRFYVRECWGWLNPGGVGGSEARRPPSVTVTVHDRAYLARVVGKFRSESQGPYTREERIARARAGAERLADYLNHWDAAL